METNLSPGGPDKFAVTFNQVGQEVWEGWDTFLKKKKDGKRLQLIFSFLNESQFWNLGAAQDKESNTSQISSNEKSMP